MTQHNRDKLERIAFGALSIDISEHRAREQAQRIAAHAIELIEREAAWINRGYTLTANGIRAPKRVKVKS